MSRYGSGDPSAQSSDSSTIPVGVPVLLLADEVSPDRNTFEGRDEPQVRIKWVTQPDNAWVFDRISLWHVKDRQDGGPSKAKSLGASLSGQIAVRVSDFWIDDDTWEFGFDRNKTEVAGRLHKGMQVAAELVRKPDQQGIERLRVSRYVPVSMASTPAAPATPIEPAEMLSPDGRYRWNGQGWVPVAAPPQATSEAETGRLI